MLKIIYRFIKSKLNLNMTLYKTKPILHNTNLRLANKCNIEFILMYVCIQNNNSVLIGRYKHAAPDQCKLHFSRYPESLIKSQESLTSRSPKTETHSVIHVVCLCVPLERKPQINNALKYSWASSTSSFKILSDVSS